MPYNRAFKPSKNSLVIGRQALLEVLEYSPEKIERIYLLSSARGREIDSILTLAKEHEIPFFNVPYPKLQRLTQRNHQGVIGFSALIIFIDIEHLIQYVFEQGEPPLFVILDGIEDVGNLGAIARTAWISGFHGIIMPFNNIPPIQEGAIKASAGALEHIHLCRAVNLEKLIDVICSHGIRVLATSLESTNRPKDIDFTHPTAIIMGSEHKGIHPSIVKKCDTAFSLPMLRNMNSYNVSAAFSMIAYEAMIQRGSATLRK